LRESLRPHLGDIEPAAAPRAETLWTRQLTGATVEALEIDTEPGITVPALLLRPVRSTATAVVVAVAQGGKDRFLSDRAATLEALLRAGVAVCLPDVRGTGETSPASARSGDGGPHHSMAQMEFDLGNSLLGARLKDLRTVVRWLRTRPDVDPKRIALWGEAFAEANPRDLFLDEVELEGGPQIQYRSEPLGAHLALLAALYEENIRAVAAQGGLAGYLTMLEDAFTYTPIDVVVHGILKAGDLADIAAALAPRPLRVEGAVNGRNIRLEQAELDRVFEPARQAYRRTKASDRLAVRPETSDPAAWLIEQLR
jgi:hypothetical protein